MTDSSYANSTADSDTHPISHSQAIFCHKDNRRSFITSKKHISATHTLYDTMVSGLHPCCGHCDF